MLHENVQKKSLLLQLGKAELILQYAIAIVYMILLQTLSVLLVITILFL